MVLKLIPIIPPERMALLESMRCLHTYTNDLWSAPVHPGKRFLRLFKNQDIKRRMSLKSILPAFKLNGWASGELEDSLSWKNAGLISASFEPLNEVIVIHL